MRYIGSKFKLIDYILNTVKQYCGTNINDKTFCDLFAGTGIVGKSFSPIVKKVYANDLEYYSYVANCCNLYGFNADIVSKIIDYCNNLNGKYEGAIFDSYSEGGKCGREYFTKENGAKIEAARHYIETIKYLISENDYYAVIYSIVSAADKVANTASTYGAFLKGFNASSKRPIIFEVPSQAEGNLENNVVFNDDANKVIKQISGDILYLDPPYNTRQYSAYYHVPNGIAKYDVPKTDSKTGVCKNAYNKSSYSIEKTALSQLDDLLNNSNFEWIFMSYNNEGIISEDEIRSVMAKYGNYFVEKKQHQRYKADNNREYIADKTIEYIYVLHKGHFEKEAFKKNEVIEELPLFTEEEMSGDTESNCSNTVNVNNSSIAKIVVSPMNYTGGKKKLISRIKELLPQDVGTFVDLFCGGCTVGINATAENVIFNDSIKPMIEMYKAFQKHSANYVINYVEKQIEKYGLSLTNREGYENLRADYNKHQKPLDLFLLTAYGFNHMIRFNSDGEYNIPFGKDRSQYNPTIRKNLETFINEIRKRNITFVSNDFRDFPFERLSQNDVVYCDPPYFVSTAAYNATWSEKEERDLLSILSEIDKRGIKFALSNVIENKGETNTILKEWAELNNYNIHHLEMSYANSSYHRKERDDKSDEVLITNY